MRRIQLMQIGLVLVLVYMSIVMMPAQRVSAQMITQTFQITAAIPSTPVQPRAVFYTKVFDLEYVSGSIILAGSEDGLDNASFLL